MNVFLFLPRCWNLCPDLRSPREKFSLGDKRIMVQIRRFDSAVTQFQVSGLRSALTIHKNERWMFSMIRICGYR